MGWHGAASEKNLCVAISNRSAPTTAFPGLLRSYRLIVLDWPGGGMQTHVFGDPSRRR